MNLISQIRTERNKELESAYTRPGYYLVKGDDRHFISAQVSEPALNRVADRVLSDAKGWDYWIDYSHGVDVHGKPAWSNIDQTDRFI
jgi:hypothetical protein